MLLTNNIQYITDASGKQTSVILQYNEWEKINKEFDELKKKLEAFNSIDMIMKKLEHHQMSILTTKDIVQRAGISETNILKNEFVTIDELEKESENW
jgi:hypothetical protein